jgi:hypothetical protein
MIFWFDVRTSAVPLPTTPNPKIAMLIIIKPPEYLIIYI